MRARVRIVVTVKEQKGTCAAGHKVGDQCIFEGLKMQGYLCPSVFGTIYRYVFALKYGADFPWAESKHIVNGIACPDAENPVVFEIRREEL